MMLPTCPMAHLIIGQTGFTLAALETFFHITGCEFYVAQKLLAWATVEGNRCIRDQYGQKNACYSVAERGRECA